MSSLVFSVPRQLCSKSSLAKVFQQTLKVSQSTNQSRQLATSYSSRELSVPNMIFKNFFVKSLPRKQISSVLLTWNKDATSLRGQQQQQLQQHRLFSTSQRRTQSDDESNFPAPYLPALMDFNQIRFVGRNTHHRLLFIDLKKNSFAKWSSWIIWVGLISFDQLGFH